MSDYLFIEPLDVLFLRGNRLFGEPGDHGEALMPPWPSLAAGAIRSRMLADDGNIDFTNFAKGKALPAGRLGDCIGTPTKPGSFRISRFTLAQKDGNNAVSPFLPLPADGVSKKADSADYLHPCGLHGALACSAHLPMLPVLTQERPSKPITGRWLNLKGITAYLEGESLGADHLVEQNALWQEDPRLGIAIDAKTRTVEKGRIYTTKTIAMAKGIGFLVGVEGAPGCLPRGGLLRFGGDGRGAAVHPCRIIWPEPSWPRVRREKRFRMVLLTPGLFPDGWKPPGLVEKNGLLILSGNGFSARLVAVAGNRTAVVSGWDLARHAPKPAQRTAPAGSVYWFDHFEGETEGLKQLEADGLWPLMEDPDLSRRAEGFNNILIAAWPQN